MARGDKTTKIKVHIDADHCMRSHSIWAICARCVNSCPGGALSLAKGDKGPRIDHELCVSCGQCLSACPLGAFSSPDFSERRLLNRIHQSGPIRLRCFLPYGELGGLAQDWDTYHLSTCLAGLTAGALYQIAVGRPCELVTSRCNDCVLFGKVKATMQANFKAAYALLADCGRRENLRESAQLFLPLAPDPTPNPGSGPADERTSTDRRIPNATASEAPAMRAKFHVIYCAVRSNDKERRAVLPVRARRKQVPRWRERLADDWNRVTHASENGAYRWPVHEVDADTCRACGICMQLCPTGTIGQWFDEGMFGYLFTPGRCAECGICAMSCPVGAVSFTHSTYGQPFEELTCFERAADPCPRCGQPRFVERNEETCRMCQRDSRGDEPGNTQSAAEQDSKEGGKV